MKANEIRVGNELVYDNEYITFDASHWYQIGECTLFLEDFKPIPLTEEWLIKMGFEIKQGMISYDKGKLCLYFGETILSGEKGRTYFNSWAILEHTPKHVHTLQNLYYALTNEELTINL
jgi:hypothetical protein